MAKKAPFMIFVKKYQKQHNIQDFNAAINECSQIWAKMSSEERRPFTEASKSHKQEKKIERVLPIRTQEILSDSYYLESLAEDYFKSCSNEEEVKNKVFYIISFNVMCKDTNGDYIPNEIGFVKYSIAKGIINLFHAFIDASDVPFGCASIANEQEQIHKIPPFGFSKAIGYTTATHSIDKTKFRSEALKNMIIEIIHMIKEGQMESSHEMPEPPIIFFSMPDQIEQSNGCIQFLAKIANLPSFSKTRVLDLVLAHFILSRLSGKIRPKALCYDDLELSIFDYYKNTNCAYHQELDNPHCALGKSRRLAYMLSKILCSIYEVPIGPTHIPEKVAPNYEVYEVLCTSKNKSSKAISIPPLLLEPPRKPQNLPQIECETVYRGIGRGKRESYPSC